MHYALIVFLILWNFGVSWFNAVSVGKSWVTSKAMGGWTRFLAWCGAVMAMCGFTWVFTILAASGLYAFHKLSDHYFTGALELGYLVVILPVLGSGFAIWADSLARAWRERSALSMGVAAYNTFAQAVNTLDALESVGKASHDVMELLSGDSDDSDSAMLTLMIMVVGGALLGGVLLTAYLIRRESQSEAENFRFQCRRSPAGRG